MTSRTIPEEASVAIIDRQAEIATAFVTREFARHPELAERYGQRGRAKSLQDAGFHLSFLAQALALNNQSMFIDYVAWAKVVLSQRKVPASDLEFHLQCLAEVLQEQLPGLPGAAAAQFVEAAVEAMPAMPDDLPTFLHEGSPLSPLAHQYFEAVLRGERHLASRLVLDAVAAGTAVKEIYLHDFQPYQHLLF